MCRVSSLVLSCFVVCAGRVDACMAQCSYSVEVAALPYCGLPSYGLGASSCNEAGDIVGAYTTCSQQGGVFLWLREPPVTFLNLGSVTFAVPHGINSRLQIVGLKEGPTGHVGFLYDDGMTVDIGPLPGHALAEAYAINE